MDPIRPPARSSRCRSSRGPGAQAERRPPGSSDRRPPAGTRAARASSVHSVPAAGPAWAAGRSRCPPARRGILGWWRRYAGDADLPRVAEEPRAEDALAVGKDLRGLERADASERQLARSLAVDHLGGLAGLEGHAARARLAAPLGDQAADVAARALEQDRGVMRAVRISGLWAGAPPLAPRSACVAWPATCGALPMVEAPDRGSRARVRREGEQELRRRPRPPGRRPEGERGRGGGGDRAVGLGEVHPLPLHQPPRADRQRPHRDRRRSPCPRRARRWRGCGPTSGWSSSRSTSSPTRPSSTTSPSGRSRSAGCRRRRRASGRWSCSSGWASPRRPTAIRPSSRAASSSGRPSPGRWRWTRR